MSVSDIWCSKTISETVCRRKPRVQCELSCFILVNKLRKVKQFDLFVFANEKNVTAGGIVNYCKNNTSPATKSPLAVYSILKASFKDAGQVREFGFAAYFGVVLANGWSAKGSDHVKSQTQGLTPTGVFQTPVGNVIFKLIQAVVGIAMPEIWLLELGKIEPDVVPEDRVVVP